MIDSAIKDAQALIERLETAKAYPAGHYGRFTALSEASQMANGLNSYIAIIPHD
jgi:hypothetical protein